MSKDKIADYDGSTAGNNTDIGGISIAEGMLPSAVNNSMRELTKQLGAFANGTDAIDGLTVDGTIKLDGNYPTGTNNVALGDTALDDGSLSGGNNTAIGSGALTANTSGSSNTAVGHLSLDAVTTGSGNTGLGRTAGSSLTTGADNTYIGYQCNAVGVSGDSNVGAGVNSLYNNTAADNVAVGGNAMFANTSGTANVAVGRYSLDANTTASNNTAVGYQALTANTTGTGNFAAGYRAGTATTTGASNTFVGEDCGTTNTTSGFNTYVGGSDGVYGGAGGGATGEKNTFIGNGAGSRVSSGSDNTILGRYNGNQGGLDIRTASNNVVLSDGDGNPRVYIDNSGTNYVWSTSAPMIWGRNETNGSVTGLAYYNTASNIGSFTGQVFRVMCDGDVENANNSYGSISDIKLKENIVNAKSQWDDLKALQVRNYNFKAETGYSSHTQIGLIAQEVELISPNLVGQSIDDETNETTKTVNYSVLYMKAVKALQEAMTRIETLEAKVATLEGE